MEGAEPVKLVLKPGVRALLPYMTNFQMTADGESFIFMNLDLKNKGVEQLNKTTNWLTN